VRKRARHRTDISLAVATLAFRQRPLRIAVEELAPPVQCTLMKGGTSLGDARVLDVSATEVGVALPLEVGLWPGMRLDQVQLQQGSVLVSEGAGEITELQPGPERRVGVRFSGGLIHLGALRLRDGSPLDPGGATHRTRDLPANWRAAVAELGQILRWSGFFVENATRPTHGAVTHAQEQAIFTDLFAQWGPRCLGSLARLYDLSAHFDEPQREAAREHVRRELLGTVLPASPPTPPAHGMLDDYALPSMFLHTSDAAATPSERFFRFAWERFPLMRTILARPQWLHDLWEGLRRRRSARVLVLQPGPAAELDEVQSNDATAVDLTLLEADPSVLTTREPGWRGRWLGNSNELHVDVRPPAGLPPSVEDQPPFDLIYGAGVLGGLDDAQAGALIQSLHGRLAPRGRLVLGNLRPEPASTWLLEYALGWRFHYREVQALGGMVEELSLPSTSWHVASDPTGRAALLDLTR